MKLKSNIIISIIAILVIIIIILSWILSSTQRKHKEYISSHVLVTQAFLDSLKDIANRSPIVTIHDSIIHDTVWIPQHHDPQPQPNPTDTTLHNYEDSLKIKDSVNVSIKFSTTGFVKGGIDWLYKPIYHIKETTIDRPVPYPVDREVPVYMYKTGYYLSLAADGTTNMFMMGGDFDIITKNDYIYGIQYRRFGKENIYGVKFGVNLNTIFKKHKNGP